MVLLYVALFVFLFFLYGIHRYILDKRYRLPPGPRPLPFLGNAFEFVKNSRSWEVFKKLSETYGPVNTVYVGQFRFITLNNPAVIQEAIVNQGKMLSDRPVSTIPGFNNYPLGVLFASGPQWQYGRRFCLKALRDFGMGKMAMVEKIHEEAGFFLAEVNRRVSQTFEPRQLLTNTVSNVICSLVFGKRFDYDDPAFVVLMGNIQDLAARPFSSQVEYFIFPPIAYLRSPEGVLLGLKLQDRVTVMLKDALVEHRKDFSAENIRDFPDLFISSELSNEVLDFDLFARLMNDMFAAGSETTSTLLNWTLLFLSKNKDVQAKCHETIDRAIGTDRLPLLSDRSELVYIDAVMYEVMRKASIVPLALFHCNLNGEVTVNGYEIPAKSVFAYNVWGLHHDETYWTEPMKFNPERWIDSHGSLLSHSTHFMPFGTGPRICLGENLARVEFFIFTVALLQRFSFSLADGCDVSIEDGLPGVTFSPPIYKLKVSRR